MRHACCAPKKSLAPEKTVACGVVASKSTAGTWHAKLRRSDQLRSHGPNNGTVPGRSTSVISTGDTIAATGHVSPAQHARSTSAPQSSAPFPSNALLR
eukprot:360750-Chlamydomonas_euryale.AAC.6